MRMRHTVKILGDISDADAMRLVARAMDEDAHDGLVSWEDSDYFVMITWNQKSITYSVTPVLVLKG